MTSTAIYLPTTLAAFLEADDIDAREAALPTLRALPLGAAATRSSR